MAQVEFELPKGFAVPEGKQKGDTFTATCDFEIKESGKVCLVKIGDTDMPDYDGDEHGESKSKEDYSDYSKSMMDSMGGGVQS